MENIKKTFKKELGREELLGVVLSYLEQIGRQSDAANMEELLKAMLREVFTAKWVQLWWPDDANRQLVSKNVDSPDPSVFVPLEPCLLTEAYTNKVPFYSNYINVDDKRYVSERDNVRGYDIGKSMLLLPVKDDDDSIVALFQLMTHTADLNQFTNRDLDLFYAIEHFALRMVHLIARQETKQNETAKSSMDAELLLAKDNYKYALVTMLSRQINVSLPAAIDKVRSEVNNPRSWEMLTNRVSYLKTLMNLQQDLCSPDCSAEAQLDATMITFNPVEHFERIHTLFDDFAGSKQIHFQLFVDPNVPTGIVTDPIRLCEAMSILLYNAIEAAPTGSQVTCSTRFDNNALTLEVTDTAQIDSEEAISTYFDPQTAMQSFSSRSNGMPVMMAACQSIDAKAWYEHKDALNRFGITLFPQVTDAKHFYDPAPLKIVRPVLCLKDADVVALLRRYFHAFGIADEAVSVIDSLNALDMDRATHLFCEPDHLDKDSILTLRYDHIVPVLIGQGEHPDNAYQLDPSIQVRDLYELLCVNLEARQILMLDSSKELSDIFHAVIGGTAISLEIVSDSRTFVARYHEALPTLKAFHLVIITENDAKGMVPRNAVRTLHTYEQTHHEKHVPAIAVLSSMASEAEMDRYLTSGVDEVLLKPLGKRAIKKMLLNYLDLKEI